MIFEWYTAPGGSKKRAKKFYRLYFKSGEELPLEKVIRKIKALAWRERDRNMRAKFLAAAKRLQVRLESEPSDRCPAGDLLREFDPYGANFTWVVPEYLEVCLSAVPETADAQGEQAWPAGARYAFAQALWSQNGLDEDTTNDAVGMVASALVFLGEQLDSPILLEMAIVAAIRAHHGDPEDPAPLRVLARAYNKLGDTASEARVVEQLREVEFEEESESESRIEAFTEKFQSLLGLEGEAET